MQGIDAKALFNLSYGLYIVGSRMGDKLNAQVANAVMQITGDPITMAVCVNKQNYTTEFIDSSGVF